MLGQLSERALLDEDKKELHSRVAEGLVDFELQGIHKEVLEETHPECELVHVQQLQQDQGHQQSPNNDPAPALRQTGDVASTE